MKFSGERYILRDQAEMCVRLNYCYALPVNDAA